MGVINIKQPTGGRNPIEVDSDTGQEDVIINGSLKVTGNLTVEGSGGGGGTATLQEDILYADLVTKINAGTLVKGQQYKITDYATVHYIVDAAGTQYLDTIITGVNEALIVTATSTNTIDKIAYSVLHPEDIIHYDWNPDNWLDDLSFADLSGTPTIVTGFKGVIYFRHDTLLDNYMGYDFRNCKFRRWKTNVADWLIGTTYASGAFVTHNSIIFISNQGSNIGNEPADGSVFWIKLLNLSHTEYWNNSPSNTNGITSNSSEFVDVLTFVNNGAGTYEACCLANRISPFKDTNTDFNLSGMANGTILSNNVFWLVDDNTVFVAQNEIGAASFCNTFYGQTYQNQIGFGFNNNQIEENTQENIFGSNNSKNVIGTGFFTNTTGGSFRRNIIGGSCILNSIFGNFLINIVGGSCNKNTFGNGIQGNTFSDNLQLNTFYDDSMSSTNLMGATHIYNGYSCTVFKRIDGTSKLSYCDNSDVIQIVDANA